MNDSAAFPSPTAATTPPDLDGAAFQAHRRSRVDTVADGVNDRVSEWVQWQAAAGMSSRSTYERQLLVVRVAREVGVAPEALTTQQLVGWFAQDFAPATRWTYFKHLVAWFRWLRTMEYRADDPTARMQRPSKPRSQPRPVSTEQVRAVLAQPLRRRTRAYILLAAYQGLRVHEIAKVQGSDFNLFDGTFYVVGKGGFAAHLPLHPRVAEEALAWPRSGYWFPSYPKGGGRVGRSIHGDAVSDAIGKAFLAAGVSATAHQLRHWYATQLLRSGSSMRAVQVLLRHQQLNTTAIYTEVADAELHGLHGLLPNVEAVGA